MVPVAVARDVRAFGAGVGDDAFEPVAARHQPFPGRPGELGGRNRFRALDFLARKPDARPEVFEDLPVRAPAPVLVVGDHLLAATRGMMPMRVSQSGQLVATLSLSTEVALPRVQPVLHREHARAPPGHVLPEIACATAEVVDRRVQAREDALSIFRNSRSCAPRP